MSMKVEITVNSKPIRRLLIENLTQQTTGMNTYRWTYARTDVYGLEGLLSAQQGRVDHLMEDGAMALIAKVAQAASETEES